MVPIKLNGASLEGQLVRNLPAIQETTVRFLGWKDPLEEDMVIHSSILAWRVPMDREAWWVQSIASQKWDTTEQLGTAQN